MKTTPSLSYTFAMVGVAAVLVAGAIACTYWQLWNPSYAILFGCAMFLIGFRAVAGWRAELMTARFAKFTARLEQRMWIIVGGIVLLALLLRLVR